MVGNLEILAKMLLNNDYDLNSKHLKNYRKILSKRHFFQINEFMNITYYSV